MRPKKYPLDPLVRVREGRTREAMNELSAAVRAREEAERKRLVLEDERARVAAEARQVRLAETARLDNGELRAADLQRQAAWDLRTQWDAEARAERVAAAREHEVGARAGEGTARSEVLEAEAKAKVVTRDQARWAHEKERAAEAAGEEAAAEAWRPRR